MISADNCLSGNAKGEGDKHVDNLSRLLGTKLAFEQNSALLFLAALKTGKK